MLVQVRGFFKSAVHSFIAAMSASSPASSIMLQARKQKKVCSLPCIHNVHPNPQSNHSDSIHTRRLDSPLQAVTLSTSNPFNLASGVSAPQTPPSPQADSYQQSS